MPDNVGYTPGAGATISTDEIAGAHHQRVKLTLGNDGTDNGTVSATNPMPIAAYSPVPVCAPDSKPVNTRALQTDDLLVMLSRIVKLLESNAVVDVAQRQRITVDAFPATIPTLTTVSGCTTVATVNTVTSVTNMVSNAGMDREQYINIAKQTYAQSIRSRLDFV